MPKPAEHSAFCTTCPSPEDVTHLLARFGLHLTYSRPAETMQLYRDMPPLPAQYHFEDDWGTQVLFLAGPDTPSLADDEDEEGVCSAYRSYPLHASRFWLIAGANRLRTYRLQDVLSARWALRWRDPASIASDEHAA